MTATSADDDKRTIFSLALSALIGPLTWSVFFIVGYMIAEAACIMGFLQGTVAGLELVVVVVLALGFVAALVSGWGAWRAYRRWRSLGREDQQSEDLAPFLALASTLLNGLFTLAIVVTVLAMIFLRPCQWT